MPKKRGEKKNFQQMVMEKWDVHLQKNVIRLSTHCTKTNFKRIKGLVVKPETGEKNVGNSLHDRVMLNDFLNRNPLA